MTVKQIADTLKRRLGNAGSKVPTRVLPNFALRAIGLLDKQVGRITPELGKAKNASGRKAEELLGWKPRPPVDSIVATGESLVRLGLLKV